MTTKEEAQIAVNWLNMVNPNNDPIKRTILSALQSHIAAQTDDAREVFEKEYSTGEPLIDAESLSRRPDGEYEVALARLCFKWFLKGRAATAPKHSPSQWLNLFKLVANGTWTPEQAVEHMIDSVPECVQPEIANSLTDCESMMILDGNNPLANTDAKPAEKLRSLIDDYISLKGNAEKLAGALRSYPTDDKYWNETAKPAIAEYDKQRGGLSPALNLAWRNTKIRQREGVIVNTTDTEMTMKEQLANVREAMDWNWLDEIEPPPLDVSNLMDEAFSILDTIEQDRNDERKHDYLQGYDAGFIDGYKKGEITAAQGKT